MLCLPLPSSSSSWWCCCCLLTCGDIQLYLVCVTLYLNSFMHGWRMMLPPNGEWNSIGLVLWIQLANYCHYQHSQVYFWIDLENRFWQNTVYMIQRPKSDSRSVDVNARAHTGCASFFFVSHFLHSALPALNSSSVQSPMERCACILVDIQLTFRTIYTSCVHSNCLKCTKCDKDYYHSVIVVMHGRDYAQTLKCIHFISFCFVLMMARQ